MAILNRFFFPAILIYLSLGVFFTASAVTVNVEDIPAIKAEELLPQAEFDSKTKEIVKEPLDNKQLAFKMHIPKSWLDDETFIDLGRVENKIGNNVLETVQRFTSPADAEYERSNILVQAMKLDYEIGIRNWFVNYALIQGYALEAMNIKNKRELEAIYVEVDKDITYVVRMRAFINGPYIVLVKFRSPQEIYEGNKTIISQIVGSFQLQNIDFSSIEELKTYGFLNQSYFDYPPSWVLKADKIIKIDKMHATLSYSTQTDKLDGYIVVDAYNKLSTPDKKTAIKIFREGFSLPDYDIGNYIEDIKTEYNKEVIKGSTQVYELVPNKSNMMKYELWVSVLEGEKYYYIITLITPARDEEFYVWARNTETYYLVTRSVRRTNDGKNFIDFIR